MKPYFSLGDSNCSLFPHPVEFCWQIENQSSSTNPPKDTTQLTSAFVQLGPAGTHKKE